MNKYLKLGIFVLFSIILILILNKYLFNNNNNTKPNQIIESFKNINNKDIYDNETHDISKDVKIYCINLDKDTDRWSALQKQIKSNNLQVERIPAVNGANVSESEYIRNGLLHKNHRLLKGQLGCALSHVKLWHKIKKDNKAFTLVLEDDIIITNDFKSKLNELIKYLPNSWDVIYLGGCNIKGKKFNEKLIYPTHFGKRYNLCTHAMLLNSERLDKLINVMTPIKESIDNQLRRKFPDLKVYYANPNMILQNKDIRSSRRDIDGLPQSQFWKEHHSDINID